MIRLICVFNDSGGVMIYFDRVEVVNILDVDKGVYVFMFVYV